MGVYISKKHQEIMVIRASQILFSDISTVNLYVNLGSKYECV